MRKIALLIIVSAIFISGQKKVDENIKTGTSFKEGSLSVECEESSISGVCIRIVVSKLLKLLEAEHLLYIFLLLH
jgi:hypothetical protein